MASLGPLEVRRRALLAASKVSLSAVLLTGCGGRVEAPSPEPLFTEGSADAAGVLDAESADSASSETMVPADAGSACGRIVEAALSDAGEPVVSTDPAVVACCREILPTWTFGGEGTVSYEVARACCEVIGGDKWWELGYPACTPWGPPMPPAFDELEAQVVA